jgi:hypothetical protein
LKSIQIKAFVTKGFVAIGMTAMDKYDGGALSLNAIFDIPIFSFGYLAAHFRVVCLIQNVNLSFAVDFQSNIRLNILLRGLNVQALLYSQHSFLN